jgi:hypothetical protein
MTHPRGDEEPPSMNDYVDSNDLRTTFASAISTMYKKEVPLYGDLISIVRDTNAETLANTQDISLKENGTNQHRLELERHGAIRLGTPYELQTVSRIFAIIGLHPVGYYDLSSAGIPMHATCFRPITPAAHREEPVQNLHISTEAGTSHEHNGQTAGNRSTFATKYLQLRIIEYPPDCGGETE